MKTLHIDIETYSSIDIKSSGSYKYCQSIDFEVLLIAYAIDNEPVKIVDLAQGEKVPQEFLNALFDRNVIKCAHNANFERTAFNAIGWNIPIDQWECSAVKSAYCGLPFSLDQLSKVLKLGEKAKLDSGKRLIKYFCVPVKPTNSNGNRRRNFPKQNLAKWDEFKSYCVNDVEAEREIMRILKTYKLPEFEKQNYINDQKINDKGIKVDLDFVRKAYRIDKKYSEEIFDKIKQIAQIENPNSPAQLKKWISSKLEKDVKSLAKDKIDLLINEAGAGAVSDVLSLRKKTSKTSTKKYIAMLNCACDDARIRGLFQFYGANRTGRWAGRLVQLQNLPRNYLKDLDKARNTIAFGKYEVASQEYDNLSDILSQLVRTAFVAEDNKTFAVADFSAIEARVVAWLANENWRIEVFKTHGKIYEASASMMFGVPIEKIDKGSELRTKGKIAELALGYQGSLGALKKMGGESMGLSDSEMTEIVKKWRTKNVKIVNLWKQVDSAAISAIRGRKKVILSSHKNLEFESDNNFFTIKLPSGRKLFYPSPSVTTNRFGQPSIKYKGVDQTSKKWWSIESYGGKLVENIVQAISRDLLAVSIDRLLKNGFEIPMHVHDEVACEVDKSDSENKLKAMCDLMEKNVGWAEGLPLKADGYITPYYKKD